MEPDGEEATQAAIDEVWEALKKWIGDAAKAAVGTVEVSKSRLPENFWTEGLEVQRDEIQLDQDQLQELMDEPGIPEVEIQARARALTESLRTYRAGIKQRRRVLFEDAVDRLGEPQNTAAFMRMVKGAQSRRDRQGCKLDPEEIENHAAHFLNTFGGDPTGRLPERPVVPGVERMIFRETEGLVSEGNVKSRLRWLPKARLRDRTISPASFSRPGATKW